LQGLALYIHIPFCDHKCIYCDFYSVTNNKNQDAYLEALKKEIDFYSSKYSSEFGISTLYFGGGTPSLVEPYFIEEIIEHLNKNFNFVSPPEITLETNPGTVKANKLKMFKEVGINRLSIGVQSFDDADLKFLTRIHNSEVAINTIKTACEAGFENLSLDLIFNLPDQTIAKWQKNLEIATSLPVKHISAYSLIVEKGTILNALIKKGKVTLPPNDYDADLYFRTIDYLNQKKFLQYEVSNFAQKGFECKHNLFYWHYKNYLGLGTSAHSFVKGKRWRNYSSLNTYLKKINTYSNAVRSIEVLSNKEMIEEFVMLGLRSDGLDLSLLKKKFGNKWLVNNNKLLKTLELQKFIKRKRSKIKFTPKGYALCDEILLNLKF